MPGSVRTAGGAIFHEELQAAIGVLPYAGTATRLSAQAVPGTPSVVGRGLPDVPHGVARAEREDFQPSVGVQADRG